MNKSIWKETSAPKHYDALKGDTKTDVLVIGGGIAGLLCAYMLKKAGVDCIVVEAGRIAAGITSCTTAKITAQHGLIYDKLIREFGCEKARLYLKANLEAVKKYKELCAGIDCDFETKDSFVYSKDDRRKLEKEASALEALGYHASLENEIDIPVSVVGALKFPNQAQFHPLKFLYAVSDGLEIYENTVVRELVGKAAVTDNGRIRANTVIVATHFPFINKHGSYFLKMYQHRSYVISVDGAEIPNGMYLDEAKDGLSFRSCGQSLLVGGGSHRTGKKGGCFSELESFVRERYPGASVRYRFATQDCMTLDGVPYIGKYSSNTDGMYVATGFNKWGMTSSMAAATILCDTMLGRRNEYSSVFSPSRTIMRPQLAVNAFEAVVNLLTPTTKRCPHLGCALKWNPTEHSWDCPCHGSRFTEDGPLIDNPATGDLPK